MKIKLLAAGLFLFGGAVFAHAQAGGVVVNVPFAFEVANKTLPPGEYVVSSQGDQVWVRGYRGNWVAVVQSNRTVHEGGKTGKVVFNCYKKLCFLSQLWLPDADSSRGYSVAWKPWIASVSHGLLVPDSLRNWRMASRL